jgi:hypothetical protein
MQLHFSRSDNNIHTILFPILSSSPTMYSKIYCLSFSLFWSVCLHPYLYLHSFLHLNLFHSVRYFPAKFYTIPLFHFWFPIYLSQQHFNNPVCPTCMILHSNFAILHSATHVLLYQSSSYFAAPFTAPGGDLRIFLHNLPCIL